MSLSQLIRPAATVAAVVLLVALIGCSGSTEPSKGGDNKVDDKKGGPGPTPPGPTPPGPNPPTPPTPPGPTYLTGNDPIQLAAEKFQKDLKDQTLTPDRCTAGFLKFIGRPGPLAFEDDKKRGYSLDEANKWLKRVGAGLPGLGLPNGIAIGNVAVFTTPFVGQGQILLRMVQTDGVWKADWVQFTLVGVTGPEKAASADEVLQGFAVQAFLDALAGKAGTMSVDDRVPLLGAAMSPKLKKVWAEPFGSDAAEGLDYNRGKLKGQAEAQGNGIDAYSFAPAGSDTFKVEITRAGMKKAHTVKLVKGTAPGEWLVDEFTP